MKQRLESRGLNYKNFYKRIICISLKINYVSHTNQLKNFIVCINKTEILHHTHTVIFATHWRHINQNRKCNCCRPFKLQQLLARPPQPILFKNFCNDVSSNKLQMPQYTRCRQINCYSYLSTAFERFSPTHFLSNAEVTEKTNYCTNAFYGADARVDNCMCVFRWDANCDRN